MAIGPVAIGKISARPGEKHPQRPGCRLADRGHDHISHMKECQRAVGNNSGLTSSNECSMCTTPSSLTPSAMLSAGWNARRPAAAEVSVVVVVVVVVVSVVVVVVVVVDVEEEEEEEEEEEDWLGVTSNRAPCYSVWFADVERPETNTKYRR
ncbi:unnamed protein product [Gadus morhua 'NCC']